MFVLNELMESSTHAYLYHGVPTLLQNSFSVLCYTAFIFVYKVDKSDIHLLTTNIINAKMPYTSKNLSASEISTSHAKKTFVIYMSSFIYGIAR